MAVLLGPTSRFINLTEDVMVVATVDEFGYRLREKRIGRGGYLDLYYREGIYRIGPPIHYLVYPENGCAPPKKILPYEVSVSADIGISYQSSDGSVVVHLDPKSGTTCGRIGLVRYANSIITAIFGNCCSAGEAAGHASAPLAAVVAPGPSSNPIQAPLALGDAPGPASAPRPSTSLSLGEVLGETPALALYPIEPLAPASALHAGIDMPSAAQVAAPTPPSQIELVIN